MNPLRLILLAFACVGLTAQAGVIDLNYEVSDTPYMLRDVSKTGTSVELGDEEVSPAVPIGFGFSFYGDFYTAVYISSNGFITFEEGTNPGCCAGIPIPTPGGIDNLIAGFWEDLNPLNGGTINYQTLGTPPNREFVVGFYGIQHFRGNSPVEMEIILHEGTGVVELQYTEATTDGESNHSVGVESADGQFGTQIDFGNDFEYFNEGRLLTPADEPDPEEGIARFAVDKQFDDGNPASVEVAISCNTGLPLQQTSSVSESDGAVFVVTDFEDGTLDCSISESAGSEGYQTSYSVDGGFSFPPGDSCDYSDVSFGTSNACLIVNVLQTVQVEVTKWWLDENPQFAGINVAEATFDCVNEQFNSSSFGTLEFVGDGAMDGFFVFPHWNGTTRCNVNETLLEGGVELDESECQGLVVTPGNGASCSIYNTRIYEGIPTLSQYGLMILSIMLLGMAGLHFRRYV